MPSPYFRILLFEVLLGVTVLFFAGCAQQVSPSGGERDATPPEILKTVPADGSLNFKGRKIKVVFNEPIKQPAFDKEILVSPLTRTRPQIRLNDNARRLSIRFGEDLRPNTTYIITLAGIADLHEGNKMTTAYSLAFSTGASIDSLEIEGRVEGPLTGKGASEVTLLLFDADSVPENKIIRKKPAYITITDGSGNFKFRNLHEGRYRIYGVVDKDQSNSWSQPTEQLALASDPLIDLQPDMDSSSLLLNLFTPDPVTPVFRNYLWLSERTLSLRFNRGLVLDQWQAWVGDSTGADSLPITEFDWIGGSDQEILVRSPLPAQTARRLRLSNLADSLGRGLDTLVMIDAFRKKMARDLVREKPAYDPEQDNWKMVTSRWLVDTLREKIVLRDTAKNSRPIPISYQKAGFEIRFHPQAKPREETAYRMQVPPLNIEDTARIVKLNWPNPGSFALIEGRIRIPDSLRAEGQVLYYLLNEKGKRIRSGRDTTFRFERLEEGSYDLRVVFDRDGNGVWTPGSLEPYRLPEKIMEGTAPISLRANWTYDDYEIKIGLPVVVPDSVGRTPGDEDQTSIKR